MKQLTIRLSLLLLFIHPMSIVQAQIQKGDLIIGKLSISLNEQIDEIFAPWDNYKTPGAAVAIVKDGEILHKKGYGLANLEYDIPIDSLTVFDIASLSKQITGFAISTLIEQGKISLDDDIRKHIPELPDFGSTITIDHLVHHTSGLRDWPGTLSIKGQVFEDVISFNEILSMAYSQKELNFTPGAEYLYSNTGYNVLAELIQRVTGYSFRQWTDDNIFQPLEMTNTHFHDDHTEIIKNNANGYFYKDGDYHLSSNNLTALGSSSLYTTIDDFVKWAIYFNDPKVRSEAIINRMLQQGVLNNGEEISYAFGIHIGEYRGINRISHRGSWASFKTYSGYFPDENISVIIFSNNASFNTGTMGNKIADIYLKERINIVQEKIKANGANTPAIIEKKEVDKTTVNLFDFSGAFYSRELSTTYNFTVVKDNLVAKHNRLSDIKLKPLKKDEFTSEVWFFRQIQFVRDSNDKITGCKISNGRVRNLYFEKVN